MIHGLRSNGARRSDRIEATALLAWPSLRSTDNDYMPSQFEAIHHLDGYAGDLKVELQQRR